MVSRTLHFVPQQVDAAGDVAFNSSEDVDQWLSPDRTWPRQRKIMARPLQIFVCGQEMSYKNK